MKKKRSSAIKNVVNLGNPFLVNKIKNCQIIAFCRIEYLKVLKYLIFHVFKKFEFRKFAIEKQSNLDNLNFGSPQMLSVLNLKALESGRSKLEHTEMCNISNYLEAVNFVIIQT